MKKRKTLEKELAQLNLEFQTLKSKKSKYINEESEKTRLKNLKDSQQIKLLKIIKLYLKNEQAGVKMSMDKCVEILANKNSFYDAILKISKSTFSREVAYYKKYNKLKPHGNQGKSPHNKISAEDQEFLIEQFDKFLEAIYKHFGKPVPMTLSVLFYILNNIYKSLGRVFPIKERTFRKWFSGDHRYFISMFANKKRRKILRKLKRISERMQELRKALTNYIETGNKNDDITVDKNKHELLQEINENRKRLGISPLRTLANAGVIIQWDGSQEKLPNGKTMYRMQAIDQTTLFTIALTFVIYENNKGYLKMLIQLLEYGIPELILCDQRMGINPAQKMALIANICALLKITIYAKSTSIHKGDLERMHGPCHAFINGIATYKNYRDLAAFQKNEKAIAKEINAFFKKEEPNFSHLRTVSEEQWKMLHMDKHKVVEFRSSHSLVYEGQAYVPYDKINKQVKLPIHQNGVLCFDETTKWIWCHDGIYKLKPIKKSLAVDEIITIDKVDKSLSKEFDQNGGLLVVTQDKIATLKKHFKELGKKEAIRQKSYEMNKQYNDMLQKKRKLMSDIDILQKLK